MDRQRVFNLVCNHLLSQKKVSERLGTAQCSYRGEAGTRCAIGCLIPDELYTEAMEGLMVSHPNIISALSSAGVLTEQDTNRISTLQFLQKLQGIHDSIHPERWESKLREFAYDYNLVMPEAMEGTNNVK